MIFGCVILLVLAVTAYCGESPTNQFLSQLRRNWKSVIEADSRHRYVQDAYINMVVMCSSQARQLATKDITRIQHTDKEYKESIGEYGNCLYNIADLLLEVPSIGLNTAETKFKQNGLIKTEVLQRFGPHAPFMLLQRAAELGQSDAQHTLATAYATGILHGGEGGLVPMDAGKALLLEYMAALSGNPEAHMGMGYRYAYGIGVPESCQKALRHYEYAANVAATAISDKGYPFTLHRIYLSESEKKTPQRQSEDDPEVISYYIQLSEEGDAHASLNLGRIFSSGNRAIDQDFPQAAKYYKKAVQQGNQLAAGQLSYILAQGLGGRTATEYTPLELHRLASQSAGRGDTHGILALAYTYLKGIGVSVNNTKAFDLFMRVQGKHVDASFNIAEMLMGRAGKNAATTLTDAARKSTANKNTVSSSASISESFVLDGTDGRIHPTEPSVEADAAVDALNALNELSPEELAILRTLNLLDPEAILPRPGLGEKALEKIKRAQIAAQRLMQQQSAKQKDTSPLAKKGTGTGTAKDSFEEKGNKHSVEADYTAAAQLYATAAQKGHLLALHRLSHMAKSGIGIAPSCHTAMNGFKSVAERGVWVSDLGRAHRAYNHGAGDLALRLFTRLGAIGYETAQFNAGHLLSGYGGVRGVRAFLERMKEAIGMCSSTYFGPTWALPSDMIAADYAMSERATEEEAIRKHTDNDAHTHTPSPSPSHSPSPSPYVARHKYSSHFLYPKLSLLRLEREQWGSLTNTTTATLATTNTSEQEAAAQNALFSFQGAVNNEGAVVVDPQAVRADCESRALVLYGLSAVQGNAEALLRLGDFYYYGMGHVLADKSEAAILYQKAADLRHTHALFNLGLMHEMGDGVEMDFHLAKRFYDQAAEFNPDAHVPRNVAMAMLQGHKYLLTSEYGSLIVKYIVSLLFPDSDSGSRSADSGRHVVYKTKGSDTDDYDYVFDWLYSLLTPVTTAYRWIGKKAFWLVKEWVCEVAIIKGALAPPRMFAYIVINAIILPVLELCWPDAAGYLIDCCLSIPNVEVDAHRTLVRNQLGRWVISFHAFFQDYAHTPFFDVHPLLQDFTAMCCVFVCYFVVHHFRKWWVVAEFPRQRVVYRAQRRVELNHIGEMERQRRREIERQALRQRAMHVHAEESVDQQLMENERRLTELQRKVDECGHVQQQQHAHAQRLRLMLSQAQALQAPTSVGGDRQIDRSLGIEEMQLQLPQTPHAQTETETETETETATETVTDGDRDGDRGEAH